MRTFHKKGNLSYCKTINVEMLWGLVEDGVYEKAKASTGGDVPVIDCVRNVRTHKRTVAIKRKQHCKCRHHLDFLASI